MINIKNNKMNTLPYKVHQLTLVLLSFAIAASSHGGTYEVTALGYTDDEHTRDDNYQNSSAEFLNNSGYVVGQSDRFAGNTNMGSTAWIYNGNNLTNLGLLDNEHTRNDNFKYSTVKDLNELGHVIGSSVRYNFNSFNGVSAWLYDGNTTKNIGLVDAEHTNRFSTKRSTAQHLNEVGQAAGISQRYNNGSVFLGNSAWIYDGNNAFNVGLTDNNHTRDDGFRMSGIWQLNNSGQAIGASDKYSGNTYLGANSWIYNGVETIQIGFADDEHTRVDGFVSTAVNALNESGYASGVSVRYTGNTDMGLTAWVYNGSVSNNIGIVDAEHTRSDGYRFSVLLDDHLNESGQVIGLSRRYDSSDASMGETAWLYNGSSTLNIGFTNNEHTRNDGYRWSRAEKINESGQVIGYSQRYDEGSASYFGSTAWLYSENATENIGFVDNQHTRDDGRRESSAEYLNNNGQVAGRSARYDESNNAGQTAWFYNGVNTIDVGLKGEDYSSNGYQKSKVDGLNEEGQVIGVSNRYGENMENLGQTAWLYDSNLDTTFDFLLSTRSDGYGYSDTLFFGEDGLVLGAYKLYDDEDILLGDYAFYFSVEEGLWDLGFLLDNTIDQSGWDLLADTFLANENKQILWQLSNDEVLGSNVYLLNPTTVPIPAAVWLFTSGLIGLIGFSRREKA